MFLLGSVLVPVAVVSGVTVAVVQEVDMVSVGNGFMSAAVTVFVRVIFVRLVRGFFALVPVIIVGAVDVAVMEVVDMVAVRGGRMAAGRTMFMGVTFVG